MVHKYVKLGICVALLGVAIWQFSLGEVGNGIFIILFALIILFLYYRNEFILLAFLQLRKQNLEGCKKVLSHIKKPEPALTQKQQG